MELLSGRLERQRNVMSLSAVFIWKITKEAENLTIRLFQKKEFVNNSGRCL